MEDQPRVCGKFPEFGIEPLPDLVRRVVVGPSQVQGKSSECIPSFRVGHQTRMDGIIHFFTSVVSAIHGAISNFLGSRPLPVLDTQTFELSCDFFKRPLFRHAGWLIQPPLM